jgi:osmotically-inducible protein OsmY
MSTDSTVPGLAVPASALMLATVAMVLIGCALTACSTTPRRTAEQRLADADTAGRVQAALLADPDLYARHIDVEVDRGVVHLGGYVWEAEDFRTARRDAGSVPGANAVVTDMELVRGGLAGTGR